MKDDPAEPGDYELLEDNAALRIELEQMAATIRKRDWTPRMVEIHKLCSQQGILAVYDLGRIVGQLQLAEAMTDSVHDGWDAEFALRSRAGQTHRKTGEP